MQAFFSLRTLAASVFAAAALSVSASVATAGDYCHAPYVPQCHYKTVTVYEAVKKPCVHYVTKYDHCGEPYYAKIVTWKVVQVPVQKQVKVCY
ncbi:MAG: hypothetical protein KDA89_01750 [Planctomycetaceae bacterium]|nr:hypothetical protein [Planctomycetaceae bacterium]